MSTSKYRGIFSGEAPVETTEFDFLTLVPELREHVLSTCSAKTRFNYAQCSKLCNSDVQLFNKTGPGKIIVRYDEKLNKTVVIFCYKSFHNYPISHPSEKDRNLEESLDEAAKIIEKSLKRVKTLKETTFYLDHKNWPKNVMKLEKMRGLLSAEITIHEAIYKNFVEFLNQSQLKKLVLKPDEEFEFYSSYAREKYLKKRPPSEIVSKFVLPNSFFKSEGYKKLDYLVSKNLDADIEEDDFMECTARVLHIETSKIDSEMLNKKIRQWFDNKTVSDISYKITSTKLAFDPKIVENGLPLRYYGLKRDDGKILRVLFINKCRDVFLETFKLDDYEKKFPMM